MGLLTNPQKMCGIIGHFAPLKEGHRVTNHVYDAAAIKALVEADLAHDLQLTPEEAAKAREYAEVKEQIKLNKFYLRDRGNAKNDKTYKKDKVKLKVNPTLNGSPPTTITPAEIPQKESPPTEISPKESPPTDTLAKESPLSMTAPLPTMLEPLKPSLWDLFHALIPKVAARGPDRCELQQRLTTTTATLFSSVLSLRQPFTAQPVTTGSLTLQFNGELYNTEALAVNDTEFVMERLHVNQPSSYDASSPSAVDDAVIQTYRTLKGEFAMVVFDERHGSVYFMRDFIGKRSLGYAMENRELLVSSIAPTALGTLFQECRGGVVYKYSLEAASMSVWTIGRDGVEVTQGIPPIAGETQRGMYESMNQNRFGRVQHGAAELRVAELVRQLDEVFTTAVRVRIDTIHPPLEGDLTSKLGVLFSGGIDCTLVAHKIASLCAPGSTIDLLSVGFENPRSGLAASQSPDRVLALNSWKNLCERFEPAGITINMVEVDVAFEEWLSHKRRVMALMYPCHTEMDLSIAIAFYFASRGEGVIVRPDGTREPYTSKCRVLFSGLGADELYAGYTRHQKVFSALSAGAQTAAEVDGAYLELAKELLHEVNRIDIRNLGRDDRVISSWGKELRYPFLDEAFIAFAVREVPLDLKYNFQCNCAACGSADVTKPCTREFKHTRKWLLRELALSYGMTYVAHEAKRAIQFGAKSAKLEIGQGKTKGTDAC